MRNKSLACLVVALVAAVALSTGCARRGASVSKAPVSGSAAVSPVVYLDKAILVAPFAIPVSDADLLSGYLPQSRDVPEVVPVHLDLALEQDLAGSTQHFVSGKMAAGCLRSAPRGEESGRLGTMRYWQNVGKCAGADFVLIPQVINWQEREGSEIGSTRPASVNLSLTILDVRTGGIVKHYHFDETQQSLAANILDARKFVSRKGRWLSAIELAQEGIQQGLKELGL